MGRVSANIKKINSVFIHMDIKKTISFEIIKFINEVLKHDVNNNHIYYYDDGIEIGYVEYYYDGGIFSENLPENSKEFYISMIEVYEKFRGKNYADKILTHIKTYASSKGATIITLRVDTGMGFTLRQPDRGLERLYLRNGFKYMYSEEETLQDDTKNLGAMYFLL